MKKMMMIAASILAAGLTQAASINWGAAVCQSDGETAVAAGSTVYLIYSATDVFGGTLSTFDTTTGLTNLGGTKLATHTLTSEETAAFAFGDSYGRTDAEGGVNGYWQMVIVDNNDPTKFATYHTSVSGITDSTGSGSVAYNQGWESATQWLGDNFQLKVVPEPTAMALLLMGVTLVGLKRRIAK